MGIIALTTAPALTARSSPASRCSSPAAWAPPCTRPSRWRTFTTRENLLPTIEACLRTFDHYGNRDNKIRARMKWLVDTMGIEELRERVIKERKFLRAARGWPGGIPAAGRGSRATHLRVAMSIAPTGSIKGVPVKLLVERLRTTAGRRPTSCAASPRARSA